MFEIEKGIPVLPIRKKKFPYPFHKMEVGDSFFADGKKTADFGGIIKSYKKVGKFITRTVEGGVRVWRVE